MKRFLLTLALVCGFATIVSAQNVVIQQNTSSPQSSQTTTGHEYYINGISTAEDIGGVDVEFKEKSSYGNYTDYYLQFTNYHDFTVRVLFELSGRMYGSITLQANETKCTPNYYEVFDDNISIIMIVRKL